MQHKKLMGIVALLMCLTLVAPTVTIEAATTNLQQPDWYAGWVQL